MFTPAIPAEAGAPASSRRIRHTQPRNGLYKTVAIFTTFAMLFGGLLLLPATAAAASATTTARLNLRTGPGLGNDVITVIPESASISVDGDFDSGYYPVTYDGTSGYASADYITFGGNADAGDSAEVSGGAPGGTAWVATDRLNFRSGPSLDDGVMWVLSNGDAVELTGQQSNGYWQAVVDGTTGWLAADYLTTSGAPSSPDPQPEPDSGNGSGAVPVGDTVTGSATVTSGLNLRSGPSTDYRVITIMSSGASVELRGDPQGGYFPLSYNGTTGWAHGDWLRAAGANPPADPAPENDGGGAVPVGDAGTGSATVTSALNLRSGPSTDYDVVTVMPSGASVELRGDPQGSYFPLSYNGATGWAHGDWLSASSAPPAPAPEPDTGNDNGAVPVGDAVTGSATVTSGLNLRTGPSTDYNVIEVMPGGASVELRGDPQGGYFPLSYNGTTGWAHGDWLRAAGADPSPAPSNPDPAPDPGNSAAPQYLYTSAAVNMRSGPSASDSVVWVIPPNTRVTITGGSENGYYPAEWAHVSGWMHGDFLVASYEGPPSGNDDMIAVIHEAADFFGQPREDMVRVAECESHFDPNAVNPVSGTSGLFQFRPSTWATTPFADEDIFDARANAFAAAWMWSVGRRGEWACQ